MAVTLLDPSDPRIQSQVDPRLDRIARQQRLMKKREVPREQFKTVRVSVEDGPVDAKGGRQRSNVTLRYAVDSFYLFAVFAENELFHTRTFDEWKAVATDALQRHCAIKGVGVKFGPRPEDTNRYNFMVEGDKPLEQSPETAARLAEQEKQRAKEAKRQAMLAEMGLAAEDDTGPEDEE